MSENTESEFKLRATQPIEVATIDATLRELGADCRTSETHHHVDTYLDDDRGSLLQAGIGLRLRQNGSRRLLTCKSQKLTTGNLLVRNELEAEWTSDQLPARASELPTTLRDAVQPHVLDRPLKPRQHLTVQRDIRRIADNGHDLCELAIDRIDARANGRSASFQEVELEVQTSPESSEELAKGLEKRLPLEFTTQDKPSHAAALLGIELPANGVIDDATAPVGDAAPRHLQTSLAAMRSLEAGVRERSNPADVRRMRASAQRMQTLLRAFRELWPEPVARRIDEHLGETSQRLGAVHNLDTLLEDHDEQIVALPKELRAVSGTVTDWITGVRAKEHDNLLTWLRSAQRLRDMQQLEPDLTAIRDDSGFAALPMAQAGPAALGAAVVQLRKQVSSAPKKPSIDEIHRIRRCARRVRHLAEAFDHLPGMDYDKSTKAVARFQKKLGLVCENAVGKEQLLGWIHAASASSHDGAWTAAVLGALSTLHGLGELAAPMVVRDAIEDLDRKKVWRRFPRP